MTSHRPRSSRRRVTWSAITLLAASGMAACYPEFRFDQAEGGAGAGGEAGASASRAAASSTASSGGGGHTATSTSTSSTTSGTSSSSVTSSVASTGAGTVPAAQVSCNQPSSNGPEPCEPGERCCLHKTTPASDGCDDTSCSTDHFDLGCDGPEDCPGQICCVKMRLSSVLQLPRFDGRSECADSCTYPSMPACHSTNDCDGFFCSPLFDGYYTVEAPEYAPHYRVCD